jgi:hypothetical protein
VILIIIVCHKIVGVSGGVIHSMQLIEQQMEVDVQMQNPLLCVEVLKISRQ